MSKYQKKLVEGKHKRTLNNIRQLVEQGVFSAKDIAEKLGMSPVTIYNYAVEERIKEIIASHKTPLSVKRQKKADLVREAIANGEKRLEELCKIARYTPLGFLDLCIEQKVELPEDTVPYRHEPTIDQYVDAGIYNLGEIGKRAGVSREWVRMYIKASGQERDYKQKRDELKVVKLKKKEKNYLIRRIQRLGRISDLASGLNIALDDLVKDWAYQQAIRYDVIRGQFNRAVSLPKIYGLLKLYENAARDNQRISFNELSRLSGVSLSSTNYIFQKLNLPGFYEGDYADNLQLVRQLELGLK